MLLLVSFSRIRITFDVCANYLALAVVLAAAYVVASIPSTLPQRLSRKLAATLAETDYVHSNANRISAEVRRILRMPAVNLQSSLAQGIEDLAKRKTEVSKVKGESEVACKYFSNLFRESNESRHTVQQIDLDAPLPGGIAAH